MPFTKTDFFNVIKMYNADTGPFVFVFYGLAAFVAYALFMKRKNAEHAALLFLAVMWMWMGLVYHWTYFTLINPAAWLFGAVFLAQGALLAVASFKGWFALDRRDDAPTKLLAATFMLYALFFYPAIEAEAARGYPFGPIFGLPCPTTIFSFGVLMLLSGTKKRMLGLLVIPVLWSLVGTVAAIEFGVVADFALPISAALSLLMVVRSNSKRRVRAALA